MRKNIVTLSALTIAALTASAGGLDAGSQALLRSMRAGISFDGTCVPTRSVSVEERQVGAFLVLAEGYTLEDLKDEPINITGNFGKMYLCEVSVADAERIASLPSVSTLRLERKVRAKMDLVRKLTGVERIHQGEDLPKRYTGKGVLCGVVDGGFDLNHINFKDEDGDTRIKQHVYFHQSAAGDKLYCDTYDSALIGTYDTDSKDTFHGTHTLGIMAGCYRGRMRGVRIENAEGGEGTARAFVEEMDNPYYGMAYESDIATASGILSDYHIALGMEEILDYAWNYKKVRPGFNYPVSINLSMGANVGPHDGSSMICRYIDEISTDPTLPAIVTIAAGNEGDLPISLHKTLSASDNSMKSILQSTDPLPDQYPNALSGQIYIYSDTDEPFDLQALIINKDRGSVNLRVGVKGDPEIPAQLYYASSSSFQMADTDVISPQLARNFEGYIGVTALKDTDESGRFLGVVDLLLWNTDQNDGNFVIGFEVTGKDGRKLDVYCNPETFILSDGGLADLGFLPGDTDGTLSDVACGKHSVVVGSYNSRDFFGSLDGEIYSYDIFNGNEVSPFSSYGTLADGRTLPHVCAPGATVISSTNQYYVDDQSQADADLQGSLEADGRVYSWYQCVGTSMATPVVSGAIALWMQAYPRLTAEQAIEAINATAIKDDDVLAGNPVKWGAGKFDAYAGLKYVLEKFNSGIDAVTADGKVPYLISSDGNRYEVFLAGVSSLDIDIFSISGAKVAHHKATGNKTVFDVSDLMPGVYIVSVNGMQASKIRVK